MLFFKKSYQDIPQFKLWIKTTHTSSSQNVHVDKTSFLRPGHVLIICYIVHKQLEILILHSPKMSIQAADFLQTVLDNLHHEVYMHSTNCQDMVSVNDTGMEY